MVDAIEVRLNEDGTLDEIVAHGAFVHLEQLSKKRWYLGVEKDGELVQAYIGGKEPGYFERSRVSPQRKETLP